jgi:hypothetical protein
VLSGTVGPRRIDESLDDKQFITVVRLAAEATMPRGKGPNALRRFKTSGRPGHETG